MTIKKESAPAQGAPSNIHSANGPAGSNVTGSSAVSANAKDPLTPTVVARYDYTDEHGELIFQVQRWEPGKGGEDRSFDQRRPNHSGIHSKWIYSTKGCRRVPYRLPELIAAVERGEPILIPEGEKDVDNLVNAGAAATCNPMGAGNWLSEFNQWLSDAHVVVVADKDPKGYSHALSIYDSLVGFCESVRIVLAKTGKDASDHLAAGNTVDDFVPIAVAELRSRPSSSPAKTQRIASSTKDAKSWAARGWKALYTNIPLDSFHRGRATVAFDLARWMRDAGVDLETTATEAMTLFVERGPQEESEGGVEPYSVSEALDTLRSAYKYQGDSKFAPPDEDYEYDELEQEIENMFSKGEVYHDHLSVALTDDDLAALPEIEWLIPGWVPAVGVTAIWGEPGVGKTYVMVSMDKAIRRGKTWQRRKAIQGGTLFYEGEVPKQLHDRQRAFNLRWPLLNGEEAPQLTIPVTPDLTKVRDLAAVVRTAEGFRQQLKDNEIQPFKLAAIIIDPLAEYMTGDELGDGMIRFAKAVAYLANKCQCAVIVGHHSNAAGDRARGNDVLRQKAFVMMRVERPDEDSMALVQQKNKFDPEWAMTIYMRPVVVGTDEEGKPRTSIVLEHERGGEPYWTSFDYEREKLERVDAAKARRRRDRIESAGEVKKDRARQAVIAAFERKKSAGVLLEYESTNALVAVVRDIDSSVSDRQARDAIRLMVESKQLQEGPVGQNKRRTYSWIDGE